MIGVGSIATWILGRGLAKTVPGAQKAAQAITWALVVLVALLALSLAKWGYDRAVVEDYKVEERAKAAEAALEGERRANAAAAGRDQSFDEEQSKLEKAMIDGKAKDPQGAAKPVGPVQRGYFDSLPNDPAASGR